MLDNEITPSPVPRGISAGQERSTLYTLCFKHLPNHRKVIPLRKADAWNGLDIEKISKEISVSTQKVSGWMKEDALPGRRVAALINLSGSSLTYELLGPFINTR